MTSINLKEISPDEYKVWFTQHLPVLQGRSPFHQPSWLSATAKRSGYDIVIIGIFDGRTLTAALPGFRKRFGPVKLFGSPLRGTTTPYLGPLGIGSNGSLISLIKMCNSFAREHWGVIYTEFGLREFSTSCREELGASWEHGKWASYVLDLSPGEESLWAKMETRFRRHVRKSQRLGLRIVPLKDARLYYQMHNETLGRRGIRGWYSESFFRQLLDDVPAEFLWAFGVEHEGNIIAAGIFFHDDCEVHYLSGASFSQYRSLPTSYLLHWHVVTSAVRAGLRIYDLGARPTANVDLFKKAFSPELVNHCFLSESSNRVRYVKNLFVSSLPRLAKIKRWLAPN